MLGWDVYFEKQLLLFYLDHCYNMWAILNFKGTTVNFRTWAQERKREEKKRTERKGNERKEKKGKKGKKRKEERKKWLKDSFMYILIQRIYLKDDQLLWEFWSLRKWTENWVLNYTVDKNLIVRVNVTI